MTFLLDRRSLLLSLVAVAFIAGCGKKTTDPPPDPKAGISTLGRLYGDFAAKNGHGPKNEAEFKEYLNSLNEKSREALGLGNVDAAFTSPRDSQPYTVKYGLQGSGGGDKKPEWNNVVEEKTGKDGVRWAASENGTVTEAKGAGS